MFAYFSQKWHFDKKRPFFFTTTQKTLFFWVFFGIFFSLFFHIFLFTFSNIKKTKTKSAHFFSRTLFLTTWQTAQKNFSHPYTLFVILNIPKKHYKIGEKQANKNLGPSFDATLDQVLTQKKPQILDQVLTLQYIYIYIDIDIDIESKRTLPSVLFCPPSGGQEIRAFFVLRDLLKTEPSLN